MHDIDRAPFHVKGLSSLYGSCYETFTGRGLRITLATYLSQLPLQLTLSYSFYEVENAYSPLSSYMLTNVSPYISNIARSARCSFRLSGCQLITMFESEVWINRSRKK